MRRNATVWALVWGAAGAGCSGGAGGEEVVSGEGAAISSYKEYAAAIRPSVEVLRLADGTNPCGREGSLSHILQTKGEAAWVLGAGTADWEKTAGTLMSDWLPAWLKSHGATSRVGDLQHTAGYWAILAAHDSRPHEDLEVRLVHASHFDDACRDHLFGNASAVPYLLVVDGGSGVNHRAWELNAGKAPEPPHDWRNLDWALRCFSANDLNREARQGAVWDGTTTWLFADPPRSGLQ